MKYIIFDFFGVLSTPAYYTVIEKYIASDEQRVFKDMLDRLDDGSMSEEELLNRLSDESGIEKKVIWNDVNAIPVRNKDLFDLIEQELKGNYSLALLTNAPRSLIDRFIPDKLELFNLELVSSELKMIKPNDDIFLETIKRCGCEPSEIFFIDDSEKNIIAAKKKGLRGHVYTNLDDLKSVLSEEGLI